MSGAFHRTLDTAVPQQFFATSMFVSPLIQGLLGLHADAPHDSLTVAPHLPPDWDHAQASAFRIGRSLVDVTIDRRAEDYAVRLRRRDAASGSLGVRVSPALPLGARVTRVTVNGQPATLQLFPTAHDVHASVTLALRDSASIVFTYEGGAEVLAPDDDTEVGQPSRGLRILDFRLDGETFVAEVEGYAGEPYDLAVRSSRTLVDIAGAGAPQSRGNHVVLPLRAEGSAGQVVRHTIRFRLQ
jgi:hypothetical protein